ncbi:hypothetical protein [Pseudarthrobacter sp. N5]|uniref:hypothetical protein n=1 Tax=Pseudarthrobacter sp. N5 TaxID=3418416 RepID=UPI003CED2FE8
MPGALEPGAFRVELLQVVRPVLDGPAEREERNAEVPEFVLKNWACVPGDVVAVFLEPHSDAGHGVEMAVNGLAGEKDLHVPTPTSAELTSQPTPVR